MDFSKSPCPQQQQPKHSRTFRALMKTKRNRPKGAPQLQMTLVLAGGQHNYDFFLQSQAVRMIAC